MLVFNSSYGKKFKKFIDGNYYVIGSFRNNLLINKSEPKRKKKKYFSYLF